jgi:hypothetical protein
MGIALFTASGLLAPLQSLVHWFMPPATPTLRTTATSPVGRHVRAPDAAAATGNRPARGCAAPRQALTARSRPLRVVRVVESNRLPASAGRMVISGRMADVCAELDRLAAVEALSH